MYSKKIMTVIMLLVLVFNVIGTVQVSHAAALDNVVDTLAASTVSSADGGSDVFSKLFSLLFDKILGPILNIFGGGKAATTLPDSPVKVTPLPPRDGSGSIVDSSALRGKVVVIDPGHGGSNPGAVANNTRETDNNLAVSLKLRDKLTAAGAKVIMTRQSDRTVAPEGSSLGQELAARVNIAETNNADIFVSIHSNSNPDPSIYGTMTFYPSGKSSKLALEVQDNIIKETGAVDKGTSAATFYVLRNTSMPSILVEMGFVSNASEAGKLQDDNYRNKIAQGIFAGIAKYFNNN
ncbi:N-acetylmuramoyl-L-alanine amidase family protein [Sporomusa acidovorans]|uniref:MurNAc-LAA domain-containing protein n=1 Tax=Sporomusa acidovorans (strain ATCC 49682 / DSM 3132 / Mol) TaxID=1123286 RepID=A0ABZ3J2L1_SPOA4|nr:N-acetylmuramoyl-L-alanine amidase [Sporomusa acidovorans]OZC20120.1 N-acetylmuramoyl-L-alanine amidase LytC precursor [Sporomusa acidovorans DSM 3132]SDD44532.1 N-acetylmuramoyl-L-alanine amidase [Sporomusa acidovorans]